MQFVAAARSCFDVHFRRCPCQSAKASSEKQKIKNVTRIMYNSCPVLNVSLSMRSPDLSHLRFMAPATRWIICKNMLIISLVLRWLCFLLHIYSSADLQLRFGGALLLIIWNASGLLKINKLWASTAQQQNTFFALVLRLAINNQRKKQKKQGRAVENVLNTQIIVHASRSCRWIFGGENC